MQRSKPQKYKEQTPGERRTTQTLIGDDYSSLDSLLNKANKLRQEGNLEEALQLYQELYLHPKAQNIDRYQYPARFYAAKIHYILFMFFGNGTDADSAVQLLKIFYEQLIPEDQEGKAESENKETTQKTAFIDGLVLFLKILQISQPVQSIEMQVNIIGFKLTIVTYLLSKFSGGTPTCEYLGSLEYCFLYYIFNDMSKLLTNDKATVLNSSLLKKLKKEKKATYFIVKSEWANPFHIENIMQCITIHWNKIFKEGKYKKMDGIEKLITENFPTEKKLTKNLTKLRHQLFNKKIDDRETILLISEILNRFLHVFNLYELEFSHYFVKQLKLAVAHFLVSQKILQPSGVNFVAELLKEFPETHESAQILRQSLLVQEKNVQVREEQERKKMHMEYAKEQTQKQKRMSQATSIKKKKLKNQKKKKHQVERKLAAEENKKKEEEISRLEQQRNAQEKQNQEKKNEVPPSQSKRKKRRKKKKAIVIPPTPSLVDARDKPETTDVNMDSVPIKIPEINVDEITAMLHQLFMYAQINSLIKVPAPFPFCDEEMNALYGNIHKLPADILFSEIDKFLHYNESWKRNSGLEFLRKINFLEKVFGINEDKYRFYLKKRIIGINGRIQNMQGVALQQEIRITVFTYILLAALYSDLDKTDPTSYPQGPMDTVVYEKMQTLRFPRHLQDQIAERHWAKISAKMSDRIRYLRNLSIYLSYESSDQQIVQRLPQAVASAQTARSVATSTLQATANQFAQVANQANPNSFWHHPSIKGLAKATVKVISKRKNKT